MTPPPTNIDGTDITGATIDGQEVQEITIDGQTVFTASVPLIEDFEDGNINGWNHITNAGGTAGISNTGFNSNHSIEVSVSSGGANSIGFFDGFGLVDFSQPFVLSAYINLTTNGFSQNRSAIGYLNDNLVNDAILGLGFDVAANSFCLVKDGKFEDSRAEARTSFTPQQGVWYEIELEFDGTDHIGRLRDNNENLLRTITWQNSSSEAESSAYVASIHAAFGARFHSHLADDFKLF